MDPCCIIRLRSRRHVSRGLQGIVNTNVHDATISRSVCSARNNQGDRGCWKIWGTDMFIYSSGTNEIRRTVYSGQYLQLAEG